MWIFSCTFSTCVIETDKLRKWTEDIRKGILDNERATLGKTRMLKFPGSVFVLGIDASLNNGLSISVQFLWLFCTLSLQVSRFSDGHYHALLPTVLYAANKEEGTQRGAIVKL